MSFNANQAYNQSLSLFSSLYLDMAPTDLPAGLSPDNQDVWFLPGSVSTRPALRRYLATPIPGVPQIVSVTDFAMPNGDYSTMFLDSNGIFHQKLISTGAVNVLDLWTAGIQFKAASAFNKQFYATYSQTLAAPFSLNPYVGIDIPRYFDGTQMWRVTQDAPGVSPTFSNSVQGTSPLVGGPTFGSTQNITEILSADPKFIGPPVNEDIVYQNIFITLAGDLVPAPVVGGKIKLAGITGFYSFKNGIQIITKVFSAHSIAVAYNFTFFDDDSTSGGTAATPTAGLVPLTRLNNIVTANVVAGNVLPTVGFFVLIGDTTTATNTAIYQTIGTSNVSMTRDTSGFVTVILTKPVVNLQAGTNVFLTGGDSHYPAGLQAVTQVISQTSFKVYFPGDGTTAASASPGSTQIGWGGTFQVLTVNPAAFQFTYFQLGPDDYYGSAGGTDVLNETPQTQVPPGPRSGVCMFKSINGAITAPSVPVQISGSGGASFLTAQNIPIGPPGTAQRILAFTPAFGSNYYYIPPSLVPSTSGLPPVIATGTIVNDNTTTSGIFDFSDVQLTSAVQIDIQGNNLFNQIVLAPCLGVIEYQSRLFWWGEINNIKNLINAGFDGGYQPPTGFVNTAGTAVTKVTGADFLTAWAGSQININGVFYTIASVTDATDLILTTSAGAQSLVPFIAYSPVGTTPPGWTQVSAVGGLVLSPIGQGFGYQMTGSGGVADGMISQPAATDFYGAPIFQPNTSYTFRCLASSDNFFAVGSLIADLFSPTAGTIATASISLHAIPLSTFAWVSAPFSVKLPAVIPSDMVLRIYLTLTPAAHVIVDELEFIDALQPVLYNQMRASYVGNEFGYDVETGLIGFDTSDSVVAAFDQRGYLYVGTNNGLRQTQNNGQTEPLAWSENEYAPNCGFASPNAVGTEKGAAWWVGQHGLQLFAGEPPTKISQEIQPLFDSINWDASLTLWLQNDPIDRIVYIGLPKLFSTAPNSLLVMSHRSVNQLYNVPDPIHTSYSGKLIATDLCRKWTRWNVSANCAAMIHSSASAQQEVAFGGGLRVINSDTGSTIGTGELYTLNFSQFTDDDFGTIFSYYTTYFWLNHDIEENIPILGLHRKLATYLTVFATGIGNLSVQPYVLNLQNPWQTFATTWDAINLIWAAGAPNPAPAYPLSTAQNFDLDFPLNVIGERIAYRISVAPLPGQTDAYFNLQHLVVATKQEPNMPVRGSIF